MRVVGHVVGEILRRIVRVADDAAAIRERGTDDVEHGPAFRAEGACRLGGGDARAVELARDRRVRGGALEIAQSAVVQVGDERGDGAAFAAGRRLAPDRRRQLFDEVLIDACARGVRRQQGSGRINGT